MGIFYLYAGISIVESILNNNLMNKVVITVNDVDIPYNDYAVKMHHDFIGGHTYLRHVEQEKVMMKKSLLVLALIALSANALAVDGGAVLGGAIGGGAGAAIGSDIGGRNGAILGGAIGGATGAAVGSQSKSEPVFERKDTRHHDDENYNEHHDNGRHLGQHKNKHKHRHDD